MYTTTFSAGELSTCNIFILISLAKLKLEKAKLPLVNAKSFLRKENIVPMKQKRRYYDEYK